MRVVLACYWLALAAGSHWPRLQLFPPPDHEPLFQPDKGLHFVAFAVLAFLMVKAGIAGRGRPAAGTLVWVAVIGLVYAGLDELTQTFAQRQVTFSDFTASAMGVLTLVTAEATALLPAPSAKKVRAARAQAWITALVVAALAIPPAVNRVMRWLINLTPWPLLPIDKPMHFIVAMLLVWFFARCRPAGLNRPRLGVWLTVIVLGLSSPMMEAVQAYVGRGSETADIVYHEMGLAAALAIWALVTLYRANHTTHPQDPGT